MKFLARIAGWLIATVVTCAAALAGSGTRLRVRAQFFIASKTHRGPQRIGGRLYIPYRGGLVAVPAGGDGTTAIDEMKHDLAEVATFMRDKYDPLKQSVELHTEEMERLTKQVSETLELQRQANRAALLGRGGPQRIRYVSSSGLSEHMADRFDLMILRKFLGRARVEAIDSADPEKMVAADRWAENLDTFTRALDSTTAGGGLELVPTAERAELWMDVHLRTAIAALFMRITMPTPTFDIPLDLGDVNWYPGTANVAATSTDLATAKRSLTAQELVAVVPWSLDLDEDAVIAVLPTVRAKIVQNTAEVIDDVILNADTTALNNINADGTTISSSTAGKAQYLLGWDGLRHIPLIDNTSQGNAHAATVTDDMFNEIRGLMDKYGVRPSELAWLMDLNTFIRAQSVANFRTIDKLGPNATLLTGQLGDVEGIPVIVSEQMALADTDGKVTSGGNGTDTGTLMLVNRTQYFYGFRRDLTIEVERDIQKRQTIMVASFRIAFEGRNANSSDNAVAMNYGITGVSVAA